MDTMSMKCTPQYFRQRGPSLSFPDQKKRLIHGMGRTTEDYVSRVAGPGIGIGCPKVMNRKVSDRRFGAILGRLNSGDIYRRQAAREMEIGFATLRGLLDFGYPSGSST